MRFRIILLSIFSLSLFPNVSNTYQPGSRYRKPIGRFKCPENSVLILFQESLPYILHMKCQQLEICNKNLTCSPTTRDCNDPKVSGLSFLHEIVEYERYDNLPKKVCCAYGPKPDEYVSTECQTIKLTDQMEVITTKIVSKYKQFDRQSVDVLSEEKERRKSRTSTTKITKGRNMEKQPTIEKKSSKNIMKLLRERLGAKKRTKRGVDMESIESNIKAGEFNQEEEKQMKAVKDIKRIKNGYRVRVCTITCQQILSALKSSAKSAPQLERPYYDEGNEYMPRKRPSVNSRERPTVELSVPKTKPGLNFNFNFPDAFSELKTADDVACFSGDNMVDTADGPKQMSELETHNLVKVSSLENGGPIYQPIEMWYHRIPDRQEQFIIINTTLSHNSLSLTPNHLIPLLDCQSINNFNSDRLALLVDKQSKFASTAQVGQCVIVLKDGHFVPEPITSVGRQIKTGIYSPITAQGSLVVNGIHVSCFTTLQNHQAQHTLHEYLMKFYHLLEYFYVINFEEFIDIPSSLKIIVGIANLILPEAMF